MAVNVAGGPLEFQATLDIKHFQTQIDRIEKELNQMAGTIERRGNDLQQFANRASAAIAGFFSIQAANNFVREIVRVRGEFESLQVSLEVMLKSKGQADALMRQMVDLAATTPFQLTEVAAGAKSLLAYGTAAQDVTDELRMLGDVASGVGAPINDLVYLYGTLQTQGRAYTKDIIQFTGRGIPIFKELERITGASGANLQKMIEDGKIGFPIIQQAFQNMTGAGGQFFNLMQRQSQTLTGQISNLQDKWDQLLNTLGKQNQGLFNDAIAFAGDLIDNYQKIIDVIETLITVYGVYKVAQMTEIALMKAAAVAGVQYSSVMALMSTKMTILKGLWAAFNSELVATQLATATAMAGLTAITLVIKDYITAYDGLDAAQKKIKRASIDAAVTAQKEVDSTRKLIDIIADKNQTEEKRLAAYTRLKAAAGDQLKSLTFEQAKLGQSTNALFAYVQGLEAATKARTLFAKFEEVAGLKSRADRGDTSVLPADFARRDNFNSFLQASKQFLTSGFKDASGFTGDNEKLAKQSLQKYSKELGKELDKLKAEIGSKEFDKLWKEMAEKPETAVDPTIKSLEAMTDAEKKAMEKRLEFLRKLNDAEEEVFRSRLSRADAEVAATADKYEKMREEARKAGLSGDQLRAANNRISNLEATEQGGNQFAAETETFKKEVETMEDRIREFQEWKEKYGEESAVRQYGKEAAQFNGLMDYMTTTLIKVKKESLDATGIIPTEQIEERLLFITEKQKNAAKEERERQKQIYSDAYAAAKEFMDRRADLDKDYEEKRASIEKNSPAENRDELLAGLEKWYAEQIRLAEEAAYRETAIFKLLSVDVMRMSREALREHIRTLKDRLKASEGLSAAEIETLRNQIEDYEQLFDTANESAQEFYRVSAKLGEVADVFESVAAGVAGLNEGLADTLSTIAALVGAASNAAGAVGDFMTGNIAGGITKAIGAITGVIKIFKAAKESAEKAKAEMEDWNFNVFQGELEINELYRERLLIAAKINKTKLDGLKAERDEIIRQKNEINQDYATVLSQLYREVYTVGQKTEKYGGFLGIGRKTRVVDITQSLLGKSYEELEQLFMQGKLEGKAKELFEMLRKLKEEGADVDKMLEENKRAAQEIFTGTTVDNIVDTIAQGFLDGKRSIVDFAESFEDLMRAAIINSLKYQALEQPLTAFYKQFADFAGDQEGLTQAEIEKLRKQYEEIVGMAGQRFEQLQNITGVAFEIPDTDPNKAKPKPNSLQGAFATASQESIDLLAGQTAGQRIATLELVQQGKQTITIVTQSLAVQQKIELNTRNSAERLATIERLMGENNVVIRSIDRKTGASGDALAANGG